MADYFKMRYSHRWGLYFVALTLAACGEPVIVDQTHHTSFVSPTPTDYEGVEAEKARRRAEIHKELPTPTPAPTVAEADKPTIALPPAPVLSDAGYQLILDFEVGGGQRYYDRYLIRPTWPGAASGVTVAIGYDLGYNSKAVILSDWSALAERQRLANVAGVTGTKARSRVAEVRDILIAWELASKVFNDVTVSKFYSQALRAFPEMDRLHPNAQAALVSLVFNRGPGMSGPNRKEMRNIRDIVPKRDYDGIAYELRMMIRIWRGMDVEAGLTRRRLAEAKLVLTP